MVLLSILISIILFFVLGKYRLGDISYHTYEPVIHEACAVEFKNQFIMFADNRVSPLISFNWHYGLILDA